MRSWKKMTSPKDKTIRSVSSKSATAEAQWKKPPLSQLKSNTSSKSIPKPKSAPEKKRPSIPEVSDENVRKLSAAVTTVKRLRNSHLRKLLPLNEAEGQNDPNLGPQLLNQAKDLLSSGNNYQKALELALRAATAFEACENGNARLEWVMCLHVIAAIYCSLGLYSEATPVLERSIEIPVIEEGQDQALAKFAGYMQLGDTHAMLGQLEKSILCYEMGLAVQMQVLGKSDSKVGETCRYVAEAHVQALQFDEAEKLCQMALDIHRENGSWASLEEAADRRLMGLICETKGHHEAALEHFVLASTAISGNGKKTELAYVDCSIGDAYLSLARYDEAVFAYQNALKVLKSSRGENHLAVASVFVRLAELYNRKGKTWESKSYCEKALCIYERPNRGSPPEEIATGLTNVSAIYESMNDLEQALRLLEQALNIYGDAPGKQSMIAGIEAQVGVMHYVLGNYSKSYASFKDAISKLRQSGERKSSFFGIALNQMGLACVQCHAIGEAANLFEEARSVLEEECGPYHPDTLGVCNNLAGTYDALGRLDEATKILEFVVGVREEKLGTASSDVDDEKRRLAELLKASGRARVRKSRSLEALFVANRDHF